MDVFQTLAGGGARFDKSRFAGDMAIFRPKGVAKGADGGRHGAVAGPSGKRSDSRKQQGSALPKELDFFGDAAQTDGAATSHGGKRKGDKSSSSSRSSRGDSDSETGTAAPRTAPTGKRELTAFLKQHKIKQTGTDPPRPMASWGELRARWNVDARLFANLEVGGWSEPTAVQMGAIPALLDVSLIVAAFQTLCCGSFLSSLSCHLTGTRHVGRGTNWIWQDACLPFPSIASSWRTQEGRFQGRRRVSDERACNTDPPAAREAWGGP